MQRIKMIAIGAVLGAATVLLVQLVERHWPQPTETITAADFRQAVESGNVRSISINQTDMRAHGLLGDGAEFEIVLPEGEPELLRTLIDSNATVEVRQSSASVWKQALACAFAAFVVILNALFSIAL